MNNKKEKNTPIGNEKTGVTAEIGDTVFQLNFRFPEKGRGSVEDIIISVAKRETDLENQRLRNA